MSLIEVKKRNGTWVSLPNPAELKITDEPVWASNTGRTSSGKMVGDKIANKRTVEVTWNYLTFEKMQAIRSVLVENTKDFFGFKYYDVESTKSDHMSEMTCYASSLPRSVYSTNSRFNLFKEITVTFIEQ